MISDVILRLQNAIELLQTEFVKICLNTHRLIYSVQYSFRVKKNEFDENDKE
jgi:hypothetical protein